MIKRIRVSIEKGVHARTAALICSVASKLNNEFDTQIYIAKDGISVPATSMLALNYMKIRNHDEISIIVDGGNEQDALDVIESYFIYDKKFEMEDLKELDCALEKSTIRSEKIIETLHNGVILIDMKSEVILANDSAKALLSQSGKSMVGQKFFRVLPNELVELLSSEDEHDGKRVDTSDKVLLVDTNFVTQEGIPIGKVAILKDITAMEKLSDQLDSVSKVKNRLGNILNNVSDGICMIDEKGCIAYVNPSFEKIFKQQADDILNKRINENNYPVMYEGFKNQVYISNRIKRWDEYKRAIVSISPIMINDTFKGIIASFVMLHDVKRLTQRLEIAEKKVEKLEKKLKLKDPLHQAFEILIGESEVLNNALQIASKVAKKNASVMIVGESGTGKELFAKGIHEASPRFGQPFIKVNCAAIPENLLESVLFGHKKGAFTGAIKDQKGQFELADGGTLFLDEIGEMPLNLQPKLLRALQEREISPIGSSQVLKVDIRIIVATNKKLEELIKIGEFREDLYYRLNVIPIYLPTLRERSGDISLLVDYFLRKMALEENEEKKRLSPETLEILENYDWPGNIRELENIILRSVTLTDGHIIEPEILPRNIMRKVSEIQLVNTINGDLKSFEEYDREIIKLALKRYGSFNKAAKALGLAHRTVSLKAKKYGLV